MDDSLAWTGFRARSVAGHTLAVGCHFIRRTRSNTSTIVLQQVLRTLAHTCGTVGELALWIRFPQVVRRVVLLHGRTLLFAHTIVEEVAAGEAVLLRWTRASSGTEQVAALSWLSTEAASARALRRARTLAKLLAVLGTFAPTTRSTTAVTLLALPFGRREVVHVGHVRGRPGNDLVPVYGLHVAQIVVVEDAHGSVEDIAEGGQLERVHLRVRNKEAELLVADVQLEQRSAADDLESWQDDPRDIDVTDQNVASHLANVLQEAQVELRVGQPSDLQVAIHVRAVGESVPQIPVVVLPIRRHRHASIGPDADCNERETEERVSTFT